MDRVTQKAQRPPFRTEWSSRAWSHVLRLLILIVGLNIACGFQSSAATGSSSPSSYGPTLAAKVGLGGAHPERNDAFQDISCASAWYCTAVGYLSPGPFTLEAMTATMVDGQWSRLTPARYRGSVENPSSDAEFNAVDCPAPGECVAAGFFLDRSGVQHPMTQTMSHGVWRKVQPIFFATDMEGTATDAWIAPDPAFTSISCISTGNCTAAGSFVNRSGVRVAVTQTLRNGSWLAAVPALFSLQDSTKIRPSQFTDISCASPFDCSAVGGAYFKSVGAVPISETMNNGTWSPVLAADFPASIQQWSVPMNSFFSISCGGVGSCTAVGAYVNQNGDDVGMSQSMVGGNWEPVEPARSSEGFPTTSSMTRFTKVSCPTTDFCLAVGESSEGGIWAYQSGGAWSAIQQPNPQVPVPQDSELRLTSVSCFSAGNCVAAGSLTQKNGSSLLTLRMEEGVWVESHSSGLGYGVSGIDSGRQDFGAVSCGSKDVCTAVGAYLGITRNGFIGEALSQSQMVGLLPGPPTQVSVKTKALRASVHWAPPINSAGIPIAGYRAVLRPGGLSCQSKHSLHCVIQGLSQGWTYRVTVKAITPVGTTPKSDSVVVSAE